MKVAIIGAGASGLTAIKCCLDEGLIPYCFEKQSCIGGLWNYTPDTKDGATVYQSTVINTSKEMMCFSDFPIPKDFPNYMHNSKVQEYFELYADQKLTTKDLKTEKITTNLFEGVLVCVGHHAIPYFPKSSFPGIEIFKGKFCHSHNYRNHVGYENLKVVVVGIGNSGGDIAVELSRHAKQVFLSTRRGSWILKRIDRNGMPLDYMKNRKVMNTLRNIVPYSFTEAFARGEIDNRINHKKYSLRPQHGVFSQHPMVNDDIANRIITGAIKVKTNVSHFTESSAVFEDGTEEEIDAVVFATGYSINYPFLNEDILKVHENDAELYKFMYPISLPKNNLAVIGGIQPLGAVNPISEMQCRWATRVIKGDAMLPNREEMKNDIERVRYGMQRRYVKSRRHTIQVDYVDYMDELADEVSCKPDIMTIFFRDPVLALKVFFGPAVPYIYRLQGPGVWPGAREAIMTVDERIFFPLATRKIDVLTESNYMKNFLLTALLIIVVAWFFGLIV